MRVKQKIKICIRKIYHQMQQSYPTFRILVWMKEYGITRRINFAISHYNDKKERECPTEQMIKSRDFFKKNESRIKNVENMLADDISRNVFKQAIFYRMNRRPWNKKLYSENDQYFVKDIISIEDGEVFIDGGAYTGDTILQFMDIAKKRKVKPNKIIAFEPDKDNYHLLSKFYGDTGGGIAYSERTI